MILLSHIYHDILRIALDFFCLCVFFFIIIICFSFWEEKFLPIKIFHKMHTLSYLFFWQEMVRGKVPSMFHFCLYPLWNSFSAAKTTYLEETLPAKMFTDNISKYPGWLSITLATFQRNCLWGHIWISRQGKVAKKYILISAYR